MKSKKELKKMNKKDLVRYGEEIKVVVDMTMSKNEIISKVVDGQNNIEKGEIAMTNNNDNMELGSTEENKEVKDVLAEADGGKEESEVKVEETPESNDEEVVTEGKDDGIEDLSEVPMTQVKMDTLRPSERNYFKPIRPQKFAELKESIRVSGVLDPIIVRPAGNGTYEILAGHNRKLANESLGRDSIPARIMDVSDEKALEIMIDTNVAGRDELTPLELARAYADKIKLLGNRQGLRTDLKDGEKEDKDKKGATRDIIGMQYGKSGMTIDRYMRLNECIPEFQDAIDREILPVKAGFQLGLVDTDTQRNLFEMNNTLIKKIKANLDAGKSVKELKEELKELRDNISPKTIKAIRKAKKEKAKVLNKKEEEVAMNKHELDRVIHPPVEPQEPVAKVITIEIPVGYDENAIDKFDDPAFILELVKDYVNGKLVTPKTRDEIEPQDQIDEDVAVTQTENEESKVG